MSNCKDGFKDRLGCGGNDFQQFLSRQSRENCGTKGNCQSDAEVLLGLNEIKKIEKIILHEVEEIEKIDKNILGEVKEIDKKIDGISEMFGCCKAKTSGPFFGEEELEIVCLNNSDKKKEIEVNVYDLGCCPKKLIKSFFDCACECCEKGLTLCPFCTKIFKLKNEDCGEENGLKDKLLEVEVVSKNSSVDDILILSKTKCEGKEECNNILFNYAYKCV